MASWYQSLPIPWVSSASSSSFFSFSSCFIKRVYLISYIRSSSIPFPFPRVSSFCFIKRDWIWSPIRVRYALEDTLSSTSTVIKKEKHQSYRSLSLLSYQHFIWETSKIYSYILSIVRKNVLLCHFYLEILSCWSPDNDVAYYWDSAAKKVFCSFFLEIRTSILFIECTFHHLLAWSV